MIPAEKIAQLALNLLSTDEELKISSKESESSSTLNITMTDKTILMLSMPETESSFNVVVKKWDNKENYKDADQENNLSLEDIHFMIKNLSNYITKISIYTGFVNERLESAQHQPAVLYWSDDS